MAASSRAKRGKKAAPKPVADQLSSAMLELSKAKAALNRAELRGERAERQLKEAKEELLSEREQREAAEIVARRMQEEHASAVKRQVTEYQEKLRAIGDAATESHAQIVSLHEEKASLLERLAKAEEATLRTQRVANAEKALREQVEKIQKETAEKLTGFIDHTTPLLEHNKELEARTTALVKENQELRTALKDSVDRHNATLGMLTELQLSAKKSQQQLRDAVLTQKKLVKRAEEAETTAAKALRGAVGDKKELTRLLKRDRQLTQLSALLQARVLDLEKQRNEALQTATQPAAAAAAAAAVGSSDDEPDGKEAASASEEEGEGDVEDGCEDTAEAAADGDTGHGSSSKPHATSESDEATTE